MTTTATDTAPPVVIADYYHGGLHVVWLAGKQIQTREQLTAAWAGYLGSIWKPAVKPARTEATR